MNLTNLTIKYTHHVKTRRVETWQIWQIWKPRCEVIKVLLPEVDLGDPLFYGENVRNLSGTAELCGTAGELKMVSYDSYEI